MIAPTNKKKKRSGTESQFPGRLLNLMEHVESQGIENVISWVLNGRGFIVHNPDRLVDILPLFFSQTKYRSFRRQLNMWHFERVEKGPSKGAFLHPYFVRGNRELCSRMSRQISLKPRREASFGSAGSVSSTVKTRDCSSSRENAVFALENNRHIELENCPTGFNIPLDMLEPKPLSATSDSAGYFHRSQLNFSSAANFLNASLSMQASSLMDFNDSHVDLKSVRAIPTFIQRSQLSQSALEPMPIAGLLYDTLLDPLDISFDDFDVDLADFADRDFSTVVKP